MTRNALVVLVLSLGLGCGGTAGGGATDGGNKPEGSRPMDSGPPMDTGKADAHDSAPADTGLSHGSVSTIYPAFAPFMPAVVNNGSPAMTAPQIVTITWPSADSNASTWEAFDDAIGSSVYWTMVTPEYGVGAAMGGEHVEISDAFALSSDVDVANFVATNAGAAWPAPTANTIYTMYLPPGQSLSLAGVGDACTAGVGGYHDNVTTGSVAVAYAVVLQCAGSSGGVDETTTGATHELVEAATDPEPHSGYSGLDDSQYLAWDIFQKVEDEVADMCEFYPDDAFIDTLDTSVDHGVQRIWSNKNSGAGNAPCVPNIESGPYFNVTPLDQITIHANLMNFGGPPDYASLGYEVLVGETKTFAIGFYSNAKTGPWKIAAHAGNPLTGQGSSATVSVDVPSGQNGTISYVTVHVDAVDSTGTNTNLITIESLVPGDQDCGGYGCQSRWMPILISSEK